MMSIDVTAIISVLIPSSAGLITAFVGFKKYQASQDIRKREIKLKSQEMLYKLVNEIDLSESSEKMFLATAVLDGCSCHLMPSKEGTWGEINNKFFAELCKNDVDLEHILRHHDRDPVKDDYERAIRQSFDTLIDFFCRIAYLYNKEQITENELDYFRYYLLEIKKNKAVRNYIKIYNFPLSDEFFEKVANLTKKTA
jgi:hypothetical protein